MGSHTLTDDLGLITRKLDHEIAVHRGPLYHSAPLIGKVRLFGLFPGPRARTMKRFAGLHLTAVIPDESASE